MKRLGGDVVAKMLKNEGVEKVFGIIDGTYFGFYSSLQQHGIELISPRHEACAVHMAAAYARTTGKLGVCMASNGPGVANLISGIAVEQAEGNRVFCITSSRRPQIIYPDRGGTYQYFDQVGVIGAMSKYSAAVRFPERLVDTVRQGFRKSFSGRPGIVHIDIPETILNQKMDCDDSHFLQPFEYRFKDEVTPSAEVIKRVADWIISAEFPIFHVGSGVVHANAYEELADLAGLVHMPVTTSWASRGALSEENPLSVPLIHVEVNNDLRCAADVVLILGSRVGETDWWGKAPNWAAPQKQKVIQVDIDAEWIGRNKRIDLGVLSDVKVFMQLLIDELRSRQTAINNETRKSNFLTHQQKMQKHRKKLDEHLSDIGSPLNTAHVANLARKFFKHDAIAVFDGGNTAVWGQFFYHAHTPGHSLGTPKMGMLGVGVSQALGAKVAHPQKQVYCMIGDGAMGFHMQEIETAVRQNLPVVYLVVVDKQWGMVKMNQQFQLAPIKALIDNKFHKKILEGTINSDFCEIEWDKLAESMGAFGARASDPKGLAHAIESAISSQRPAVIHIDVDPLKHMWAPSLQDFKKMHEEPEG
jgi:acetolactate synthase-1/2/3 large subunit